MNPKVIFIGLCKNGHTLKFAKSDKSETSEEGGTVRDLDTKPSSRFKQFGPAIKHSQGMFNYDNKNKTIIMIIIIMIIIIMIIMIMIIIIMRVSDSQLL